MTIPEIRTKVLGLMDAIDTDLVQSGIDSNTLNAIGQLRKLIELLPDKPETLCCVCAKPFKPNDETEIDPDNWRLIAHRDCAFPELRKEPKSEPSKNLDEVINTLIPVAVNYLTDLNLDDISHRDFDKLVCSLHDNFKRIFIRAGLVMPVDVECSECGNTELRYANGDWYMKDEPPREDNVFCRKCSILYELTFVLTAIEAIK